MKEFRDLSRLPVDPEYWNALEARIMSDLGPRVRGGSVGSGGWLRPLSARAWTLGAVALAAGLAGLILVPPRDPDAIDGSLGFLGVPAKDPVVAAFISAPAPPAVAALVLPEALP